MPPVNNNYTRFDGLTILFHWLIALLVIVQIIGAHAIDFFPKGDLRVDARSVHIAGGAALGAIVILSILWRRSFGRQLPPPGNKLVTFLANAVQILLNLLVLGQVAVGLSMVGIRGTNLFNVYPIPGYDPDNKALLDQIFGVHAAIAWTILGLAAFHAAAALVHHYVWKDGVLDRIKIFGVKATPAA
nr:cytochrome b/b6 domain-containing protein [uncultured Rhodopila sp.]